jgi:hypothetical protein
MASGAAGEGEGVGAARSPDRSQITVGLLTQAY